MGFHLVPIRIPRSDLTFAAPRITRFIRVSILVATWFIFEPISRLSFATISSPLVSHCISPSLHIPLCFTRCIPASTSIHHRQFATASLPPCLTLNSDRRFAPDCSKYEADNHYTTSTLSETAIHVRDSRHLIIKEKRILLGVSSDQKYVFGRGYEEFCRFQRERRCSSLHRHCCSWSQYSQYITHYSGKDATDDFEDVRQSDNAREMLKDYYVGDIDINTIPLKQNSGG
ncbi:hypothetical protein RND81_02G142800 [Saponaria officinalis]|uniref:Cytochrome b5 heme-binding domain-containing protein n=1 Tax=Saponaria officinalis TaxID=3572 RepID=A0AAW1MMT7_SAPOF